MENSQIAAAAVNVNLAQTKSQIAIATLKQGLQMQQNAADSLASSVERVGSVIQPGQSVTQAGRLLDQSA